MRVVTIKNLSLHFNDECIFRNLSFVLEKNSITALLGRSGVGKSSLLRLIAGFEDNALITGVIDKPPHLSVAYLSQQYSLYPWLSVIDNIQLQQSLTGTKTTHSTDQAKYFLTLLGLEKHFNKKVFELSGGQRQRVALARILMQDSDIVLMDEPFSALDEVTKIQLLQLSKELLADKTVLMVTHSPSEALTIADRIFVLKNGDNPLYECRDFTNNTFSNNTKAYDELIAQLSGKHYE